MHRRTLLTGLGAVGLSGCTIGGFGDGEPVRLGVIDVENHTTTEREVAIRIRANGELAAKPVVEVPAGEPYGHLRLERTWPAQARDYSIRLESGLESDPLTISIREPRTETCETVLIRLRSGGIVPYRGSAGQCYDDQDQGP